MSERVVNELSREDCFRLLRTKTVGRLAFMDDDGPIALPFNFSAVDDDVAIRVEPGSTVRSLRSNATAAFEVDHIDDVENTGWSVVVRGEVSETPMDDVPELLRRMGSHFPRPWAAGIHNVWLVLATKQISGRALGKPYDSPIF